MRSFIFPMSKWDGEGVFWMGYVCQCVLRSYQVEGLRTRGSEVIVCVSSSGYLLWLCQGKPVHNSFKITPYNHDNKPFSHVIPLTG